MNRIIIIGNLGRDPEMKYLPSGTAVTNFTMASNHKYTTSSGTTEEETEWFSIAVWGKLGESANKYLRKGSMVFVEGRLTHRLYQTRDQQTRVSLDVNVDVLRFLSKTENDGNGRDSNEEDFGDPPEEEPAAQPPNTSKKPPAGTNNARTRRNS